MTRRVHTVQVTIAAVCAGCLLGCAKQPAETNPAPRVSVQRPQQSGHGPRAEWSETVFQARYADPELPPFPPEAVVAEVDRATVRADFTVLPDGRAHDLRLELVEEVPEGERFIAACADVLTRWRFSPAWRLARDSEPQDPPIVLVPSKAQLIFRFDLGVHLEGGAVDLSFGPTQ